MSFQYRKFKPAPIKLLQYKPVARPSFRGGGYRRMRGATRKSTRGGAEAALAVAKRALRAATANRARLELKYIEFNLVNYDIATDVTGQWPGSVGAVVGNGGAVCPLTVVAQQITDQTRIGEQIHAEGVEIRGHLMTNEDIMNCAMRFILFRDNQQRASTVPTIAEVLQYARTNSLFVWDERDRWQIYMDETVQMTANTNSFGARQPFQFKKKLRFPVEYASALSTSCMKNGLYLLIIADYGNTATGDTTSTFTLSEGVMDLTARFLFTDS